MPGNFYIQVGDGEPEPAKRFYEMLCARLGEYAWSENQPHVVLQIKEWRVVLVDDDEESE